MRLKYFFIALILSCPVWWGVNVFAKKTEGYIFSFISQNQQIFNAQLNSALENTVRKYDLGELDIKAKSAASILVLPDGSEAFLYKKNIDESLPIASLTKLMAADVVLENFDVSQKIKIEKTIAEDGVEKGLKKGESFFMKDLLYAALVESNNSAIQALSEIIGQENFVALMNMEAKYLGMKKTNFINPTGLDPDEKSKKLEKINQSNVKDLIKLSEHIVKNQEISRMISTESFDLHDSDGKLHHKAMTTDEFLESGVSFGE